MEVEKVEDTLNDGYLVKFSGPRRELDIMSYSGI